ncbi:MAG: carbohydrate ABC transporter substrate-binding protein [Eubacterium sp.]|nr:carbohydrate ABC transporter substrate-binding protein [Eubacterium sp.]
MRHDLQHSRLVSSLCLIVFAAFLSAAAVSSGKDGKAAVLARLSDRQRPVRIWAWDENYNITAVNEAVRAYKKRHPDAEFQVVSMTQEECAARLNSLMLIGSRRSLPDIALIEDYQIQYFLQDYADEFLPLNSFVDPSAYAPCKTGVNCLGDAVYGVPFDSGTAGLFYRLDLIEKAGYCEEDMRMLTWEKFIEIGKQVKEKTGKAMLAVNPSDLTLIRMMLQSAGAWYTDDTGELFLEGNEVLSQAAAIYKEMVVSGITVTVPDWNHFVHGFWEEKAAAVLTGSWVSAGILEQELQSGLWRVAQVPRMQDCPSSVNASSIGGSGWYIFRYAGMAKEAAQFLEETFASDLELIDLLAEKINLVSTLKAARHSENYKKGLPFYGGQKIYSDLISWTYEIPQVNYGTDTYGTEEMIAALLQDILAGEDISKVLSDYQKEYGQHGRSKL